MYSISDFGSMIADKGRTDPYVAALRDAVESDSIVMDIGTGTGIFALLACHFGARHVYAIEPNDAIQVGRELAAANGFSEKITFIQDLSTSITLPEKANIIISDLHGMLPLYSQHLPSIIDARERHLASEGRLIPSQEIMRVALVEAPDLYQRYVSPWKDNQFEIDMQATLRRVRNTLWFDEVGKEGKECIVGEEKTWATLEYQTLESPNVSGEVVWQIEQRANVHGFRIWFDTELAEGVGFTNAPDQTELVVYGSVFFPLLEPVLLNKGESVSLIMQANLVGDEYIWRWHTRIYTGNDPDKVITEYKQSNFDGVPFSLSQLQKRAGNYKPDLNEDGLLNIEIMKMMEQGLLLEDIAHRLTEKFPERYADWQHALADVGKLSIKYSK
jgi:protein arginine N-methyltransferase 1